MMLGLFRTLTVLTLATLVLSSTTVVSAQNAPQGATTVPVVVGPLPVTAESYPYMMATTLLEPMDLSRIGYVEEEFFVSGSANIYDWAPNGDLTVSIPNAPYTTRLLVRRPSDPARFSGNVIVEIMHAPFGQDFGLMWGWAHQGMIEQGNAWVGVTVFPSAIASLKRFNPTRYAPLSFANPTRAPCPAATAVGAGGRGGRPLTRVNNDPSMEEGLRWDMISQVGALLKSSVPNRPLAGLTVEYLYQTTQDTIQLTYINAIHPHANLDNGRPVYDGYLVKGYFRPARISRCATAPGESDPRHIIRNVGVPVMHLQMEGDFPNAAIARRPDSDEPGDRFRLYEIAGTAHFDSAPYRTGFPALEDMKRGGLDLPTRVLPPELGGYTFLVPFREADVVRCEPEVTTEQPILGYIFHSAFANLDRWVRDGTPPPRAPRLQLRNVGTPHASVATDAFGNGLGGVRTPYVDVPTATYHLHHEGGAPLCRQFGYEKRFGWARLESIYGSYTRYAAKVQQAVDAAVTERWITETDGETVTLDLLGRIPAPPRP